MVGWLSREGEGLGIDVECEVIHLYFRYFCCVSAGFLLLFIQEICDSIQNRQIALLVTILLMNITAAR